MTWDEAITVLLNVAWLGTDEERERIEEAVSMAIEALKQGEVLQVLQEIREEIRKDAEWWSEHDSLREQVLRDVIEDIIDKHIGDMK